MPRRVTTPSGGPGKRPTMPGADELFRATTPAPVVEDVNNTDEALTASGRVKHDEKMTVYVTGAELLAVEQARLQLRSDLGRSVDRGRFVRAALAIALADLDARGTESDVAQRLSES